MRICKPFFFVPGFCLLIALTAPGCKNMSGEKKGITSDDVNVSATASDHQAGKDTQPQFSFETEAHDFGKITQGEKVTYSFRFKNTGGSDLIISEAHGSCGCTVPQYPRGPISPGSAASVDITFDSDGKSGKIEKSVSLSANTSPNTKILKITAQVEIPEEK
jgi:hypothetical protein